jgi:hypothetical protein
MLPKQTALGANPRTPVDNTQFCCNPSAKAPKAHSYTSVLHVLHPAVFPLMLT